MRLGDLVELSEHGKNATFKDPDGYEVVEFEQQHDKIGLIVDTKEHGDCEERDYMVQWPLDPEYWHLAFSVETTEAMSEEEITPYKGELKPIY